MLKNNVISIDFEDWYHELTSTSRKYNEWRLMESRIEHSASILLHLLKKRDIKATFFVLGIIAKEYPELIRKIASEGHEIGVHTYKHNSVKDMTQKAFEIDLETTIAAIEAAVTGIVPIGFRAPYFSINNNMSWFYESLAKYGFKCDSSVFPMKTPLYGIKKANRFCYEIHTKYGKILEFPISTYNLHGIRFPMAGGLYFRLMSINLISILYIG